MKKLIVAVFGLCIFASSVFAEGIPAPLGMKWGDSEGVITKNYGGVKVRSNDGLVLYSISNPPLKLDGIDYVIGMIYPKFGLVKVTLAKKITDDAYGVAGKKLYNDYKNKLTVKYGNPKSYEYTGQKFYTKPDEYYQCLSYQGCGGKISLFEAKDGSGVGIQLVGSARGEGGLMIDYESKVFSDYKKEMENEKNRKDNAGL